MNQSGREAIQSLVAAARSASEKMAAAVEGLRSQIAELNRRKRKLQNQSVDFETAAARLVKYIDGQAGLAEKKSPSVEVFTRIGYDRMHLDVRSHWSRDELLFAALAPQLKAILLKKLEAHFKQRPGIAADDRAEQIAEIDRELRDLELSEESCIRAASRAGFEILRRADANPAAVLASDDELP